MSGPLGGRVRPSLASESEAWEWEKVLPSRRQGLQQRLPGGRAVKGVGHPAALAAPVRCPPWGRWCLSPSRAPSRGLSAVTAEAGKRAVEPGLGESRERRW